MWCEGPGAYVECGGSAASRLTDADDEMDALHVSLTAEMVSGDPRVPGRRGFASLASSTNASETTL